MKIFGRNFNIFSNKRNRNKNYNHNIHLIKKLCLDSNYDVIDYKNRDVESYDALKPAVPNTVYIHNTTVGFTFVYRGDGKGKLFHYNSIIYNIDYLFELKELLLKKL